MHEQAVKKTATVERRMPNGNSFSVNPEGAKITLSLERMAILISALRGDGKQGITHPCAPIFGPGEKYGLKQHGNMRNELCEVQAASATAVKLKHLLTDKGYEEVTVEESFELTKDGSFKVTMTHTNNGDTEVPVNTGQHFYFDAPEGYKGTTVNGRSLDELIENNHNGIAIKLEKTNTIAIPGKQDLELTQDGFNYAMVWVGRNKETGKVDNKYVCIEPVEQDPNGDFFGSPESMLQPGQSRVASVSLAVKKE